MDSRELKLFYVAKALCRKRKRADNIVREYCLSYNYKGFDYVTKKPIITIFINP